MDRQAWNRNGDKTKLKKEERKKVKLLVRKKEKQQETGRHWKMR